MGPARELLHNPAALGGVGVLGALGDVGGVGGVGVLGGVGGVEEVVDEFWCGLGVAVLAGVTAVAVISSESGSTAVWPL